MDKTQLSIWPSLVNQRQNNIEASDVPIPEDAGDGLVLEDYWIVQKDKIIRRHVQPRTHAFSPAKSQDCPTHPVCLCDERKTIARSSLGKPSEITDNWVTNHEVWERITPWTGDTVFWVNREIPNESPASEEHHEQAMVVASDQCWEAGIFLTAQDEQEIRRNPNSCWTFVASAAKRQRVEVKLKDLGPKEAEEFRKAQNKEIQRIDTGTIRKVQRNKIPESNIMQSRWIHTWKELDPIEAKEVGKNRKAKSRLVVLGYQDPNLEDIPRDSPTMQKETRSLLLQLVASKRWKLRSFDIKTAFLRGSRRHQRPES